MLIRLFLSAIFCLGIVPINHFSQNCSPPQIVANATSNNIFSPDQEMILGELFFQSMSSDVRLIRDEKLLAYVNGIGEKLIKHLPNTGLKFQFHLMDIPEANAFNISGGHVFLSRKLIAFSVNEDELAGVMAHELGHATVHHGALDISEAFKKILNITKLGDRKDIVEKYNLLIENARTKSYSQKRNHEDVQQMEADKIGLYAMASAGYDPNAFTSFFDRLAETEGKTGGWWSDVFGKERPDQKRLREMIKLTNQLPESCRERNSALTESFQKWQADVVSFRATNRKEELPALLSKKELSPKIRSDVWNFAFSPDGKVLLAQDNFSITVIQRENLQFLFQIPAEDADVAAFTDDNKSIVFVTDNSRFERWDLTQQKALEIKELVLRRDCWESKLSPDGNHLACIDTSTKINIFETKTGKKVFEKKDFYPLNFFEYVTWLDRTGGETDNKKINFFRIEFSPDTRYVMFSRSNRFRYRFSVDGMTAGESENTVLALEMGSFKPIEVGKDIKKLSARAYLFLDSERIIGMPSVKGEDAGVFIFPSGKRLSKVLFSADEIKPTSNLNYLIIKPLQNAEMGVYDIKKGAVVAGMNKSDATFWDNLMIFEASSGKIQFRETTYNDEKKYLDGKELGAVDIPAGLIGNLSTAKISDGFGWLLLSSKTRGGMWNLATGERKMFVRGFRNGVIDDNGISIADFPKLNESPRSLVYLNSNDQVISPVSELPEKGARQFGRFVLMQKSLKEQKKKEEQKSPADGDSDNLDLKQNVKYELFDIVQNKVVWTKDFPKNAPRYSFDSYSGRLIFFWSLKNDEGKNKLKENPEIKAKSEKLGNKDDDYLVEVIDAFAQKTIGTFLLETGNGSFDVYSGLSEGNWVMFYDSEDRILVYSLKDGEIKHRFIGKFAAINPKTFQIAVENFPGEISLYDLESGNKQTTFVINGKAVFLQFKLSGDRLFILSDSQNAYTFDLTKLSAK